MKQDLAQGAAGLRRSMALPRAVGVMIAVSAIVLFVGSSVRHALFRSSAFDLGWFDQAVYLISQGQPPIVSFAGFHILGDHAAWIFYPLALLYRIYPTVHWLFAVQAIALAIGALPTWHLARQAGLKDAMATTIAAVYLLYPLVFNVNLYDFHPETIAVPALLGAVLAARTGRIGWFCGLIVLTLGCKAVLSLTVAAMGLWLAVFERKRWSGEVGRRCLIAGCFALFAGTAWFLIATQVVIPTFSGSAPAAVSRYAYLGNSVGDIARNVFLKPGIILGRVFSIGTLEYLLLLLVPLAWGLSMRQLTPLISAVPALMLNILSDAPAQRNLVHQYSLPILPFLLLVAIATLANQQAWLKTQRAILIWSCIAFLALAKYPYFGSIYLDSLDTWHATRTAIAQVPANASVLTTSEIAPHLTHRRTIQFTDRSRPPKNLTEFDAVLLNAPHPGWLSTPEFVGELVNRLQNDDQFQLKYQQNGVFLFVKT